MADGIISGMVTDTKNKTLGGVTVTIDKDGTQVGSHNTDDQGSYLFSGLASGEYSVKASKTGYQSQSVSNQYVSDEDSPTIDFMLEASS